MLIVKSNELKTALDLAVEHGRFPPAKLHMFAKGLSSEARLDAFMKVSSTCPSAVPYLLRSGQDGETCLTDVKVDHAWRMSFQEKKDKNESVISVH